MSFDQYSETPASNDIPNYFQTGMAPSKVKNAGWDVMADLASRFAAIHTTGGTATAYTLTQTRQFGALVAGLEVICIPNATCTGAATFAPDGLTAKNIFANGAANIAGQIVINVPMHLKYDGTQWNLLNPQRAIGSFTLTVTGMSSGVTGTVNYTILPDGKTVYIAINTAITGTSNATTMTGTGVPAILATSSNGNAHVMLLGVDNGINNTLNMGGMNTTTWTFTYGPTIASFTASGTKGINGSSTSWGA